MISPFVIEKLEYQKVLTYISKYSNTEKGRNRILKFYPSTNKEEIIVEGKLVSEAKEILIKNVPPPIEYLPDLNETIAKSHIEGSMIDGKKVFEILRLAIISRNILQFLKNNQEDAPKLREVGNELFVDKMFEHHIQKVINENGEIKDNASQKLSQIRREIRDRQDDLVRSINRIIKKLTEKDFVREDYLTLRDGRMVIPIKAEHKRHLRGFIHSESSSGQTVYIEPEETLELNNEIVSLYFAERREIERLLKELTKLIGNYSGNLNKTLEIIAYIDSIFARAKYSVEIIGSFPTFDDEKPYLLLDGRHPLLIKKFNRSNTVPLKAEIKDKNVVLITGPNAGGKTVVLKTIGILSLLVQSGIHVPISPDSNFHLFNNILVDIGDEQSIEDDLSTFSSHLSNIKNILENSDENSLVLLDEIGTGTDPAEGSALAAAILISLQKKKAIVFATTHHGGLKLIANELTGFENAAMEFDNQNLKPTYLFKQGIPGSSYAFEVAKRIGFKDDFLGLAKEYLDTDKHKVENFLVDIEKKSKLVEDKLKKAEIENVRLSGLSNLYKQNIDKLDREKKQILKQAKTEAESYLKGINKKIEQVIKDLKETKADSKTIKETREIIKDIKEENKKLFVEDVDSEKEKYQFMIGDYATIKNTQTTGEIMEISASKGKATLRVGTLKLSSNIKDLIPAKKSNQKEVSEKSFFIDTTGSKIRLDIRGEKPDEAEYEVIRFIDNSYSGGLERVEILHGKGTGALKKMVSDILKNHSSVKNFYFAPIELGGEGITIAELK